MNQSIRASIGIASIAGLLVATATLQFAQSANRMMGDNSFAAKAAQGGNAEVELGRLAQSHASSDKVKQFGQQMVTDHSKAGDELAKIAAQKNIALPGGLNAKDQAIVDRLSQLNGAAFDRAYMQDMVKDHREDIAEFKKEANSGQDPDFKAFASNTLATLQHHLSMAEETSSAIGK